MDLQDCIVFLLAKNSQAGYKFWADYISEYNVTTVQAMFLILLNRQDGITSREMSSLVKLDSATVSGIIDRLVALDLVERRPSMTDRRSTLIYLKEEGRKKGAVLDKLFEKAHKDFLSSFTDEEENFLRNILKRLLEKHSGLV
ncbi:MAG: MarR family transcriptional regulator [Desulforegulaceae bacterium]|jgi:DNA-binding MarR family transcriptional regulator|nr:MarR family transcriptional regulator [Desulforegulaceae bacterium]